MFRLWRKPRTAKPRTVKSQPSKPPLTADEGVRRKPTDTDGARRRMRQTVEDNRLL